ncbi:uncharacterized protein EDB91DRAFT_1170769, partial [Suillus paluster]|uniref:uncharacterized protein n=1 Tax=Suillus paluster TaxID=48578 RepID=UPI001B872990
YENSAEILFRSFMMIILSEIGDKTFFISAILSMRHARLVVFLGAFTSLLLMSMLSASLGHILPTLLPKKWTQVMAGVLFLVFGSKMVMEAKEMEGSGEAEEEMKEAEEEIEGDEFEGGIPLERLEEVAFVAEHELGFEHYRRREEFLQSCARTRFRAGLRAYFLAKKSYDV